MKQIMGQFVLDILSTSVGVVVGIFAFAFLMAGL